MIQAWPGLLGQTAEDDNKMTETELVLAGRQAARPGPRQTFEKLEEEIQFGRTQASRSCVDQSRLSQSVSQSAASTLDINQSSDLSTTPTSHQSMCS